MHQVERILRGYCTCYFDFSETEHALQCFSKQYNVYSLQTGHHFVVVHKHHVKSCMTTGCICPFLTVYAEVIIQGLGLTRG